MSRHNTIRASLAMAAAALAIGATSAGAMPIREGSPPLKAAQPLEVDASHAALLRAHTVIRAAEQTRAFALAHGAARASLDQEQSATLAAQRAQTGVPQSSTTKVIAQQPAQPVAADDGNDIPLIGIILALAGAGFLGVGAAVAVTKSSRSRRARVA